ncbi:hypothetical protein L6452_43966 [Arctium lappa]|uniref:Uncharacterized protein n=1 Tax=Arctium lappa TaxID=4217 RepID=A0ACB8XEH0_ARCLA|nr:hypothetical protein L6452_43966 [Arctium lappa]
MKSSMVMVDDYRASSSARVPVEGKSNEEDRAIIVRPSSSLQGTSLIRIAFDPITSGVTTACAPRSFGGATGRGGRSDGDDVGLLRFDILVILNMDGSPTNSSFLDLLRNFEINSSNVPFSLPNDNTFETDNDFGFYEPNSQYSEDSDSESMFNIEDDSDDVSENPVVNFMNDVGDVEDDDIANLENNIHIDVWSESENKIRLGMQFESKAHVKKAVTLWSITQNREFKVYESKSSSWLAKCKTLGDGGERSSIVHYTSRCAWYVRAVKKKNDHMWKITRSVDAHNYFGSCTAIIT